MAFKQIAAAWTAAALFAAAASAEPQDQEQPEGEKLYQLRCAACHSINPPPKLAPPVRGIVRRYTAKHETKDAVIKAITAFAKAPSPDHMVFPEHAKERFGEMPPIPFDENELQLIASWMWEKVESLGPGPCMNCGRGHGECQGWRTPSAKTGAEAPPKPQDDPSSETSQTE